MLNTCAVLVALHRSFTTKPYATSCSSWCTHTNRCSAPFLPVHRRAVPPGRELTRPPPPSAREKAQDPPPKKRPKSPQGLPLFFGRAGGVVPFNGPLGVFVTSLAPRGTLMLSMAVHIVCREMRGRLQNVWLSICAGSLCADFGGQRPMEDVFAIVGTPCCGKADSRIRFVKRPWCCLLSLIGHSDPTPYQQQ